MGGEGEGPDSFTGGESGAAADVDLAIETGELEVGAAGVELDGTADALEVRVAEELSAHGDGTADVGEGGVVAAAFDGDGAGDAVGGEIVAAVVDAGGDVAGDGAEFDVAMVGGDDDGRFDGADLHVAVVGVDGGGCGCGQGDDEVGARSIHCRNAEGDVAAVGDEFGAEALGLAVGLGVGAGVDLFVRGDVDLVVITGAGDRDVAAGIVDQEGCAGGEGLGEGLIALVFVAEELVEVVLIDVEAFEESGVAAFAYAAEDDAGDAEEDEQGEDASANATAVVGLGGVGLDVLVVGPFEQHDDAGGDEEERPEATVPVPHAMTLQVAGLDEQKDDADGDEHQGAKDRAATQAAGLVAIGFTLGAEHVALGTGLVLEHAALVLPVVSVRRTGRWRVGWRRIASHDFYLPS